jgi:hypothetical protein
MERKEWSMASPPGAPCTTVPPKHAGLRSWEREWIRRERVAICLMAELLSLMAVDGEVGLISLLALVVMRGKRCVVSQG